MGSTAGLPAKLRPVVGEVDRPVNCNVQERMTTSAPFFQED